ncbi:hypothetical protein ABK040_002906 [Willaertia magna]
MEQDKAPEIYYSDKYYDDKYEYRHVVLPDCYAKHVPKDRLLSEVEWRGLGIQMSHGWIHYGNSPSEPNILLFKREFTGDVNPRQQQILQFHKILQQREKNL